MPRIRERRPKPGKYAAWNTDDPEGFGYLVTRFFEWMRVMQFSEETIVGRESNIRLFSIWAAVRGITRPKDVTRPVLERYQRYLHHYRKADGQPLSARGHFGRIRPLRSFFSWLAKHNHILSNPAADLEMPRSPKYLPMRVFTVEEVERILAMPDLETPMGIRDRAIMETLYATGIRRSELVVLKIEDVNFYRKLVTIQQGKGRKDRVVPIGERALAWIEKYLREVRPHVAVEPDEGYVFLNRLGGYFTSDGMSNVVRAYVIGSGVRTKGACHLFRHTMATLMLEGGADIRFIQQMLGHEDLKTTQIYTQVSIGKLQEVYQNTHPAAKLARKEPDPKALADAERLRDAEVELFADLGKERKEEEKDKR